MTLIKAAFTAVHFVGAGAVAQAQVIYNTFGAGNSFNTGTGYTISGAGSTLGQNYDQGEGFFSAATGAGQSLEIAMGHVTGSTSVTMRLYDADGSGQIGSQNGSDLVLTTSAGSFGSAGAYINASLAGLNWNFTSGNKYWLIADAADDSWHAWNFNDQGITGDHLRHQIQAVGVDIAGGMAVVAADVILLRRGAVEATRPV